jgi:hypothetical protein
MFAVGEDQERNMPSFQFPSPEERVEEDLNMFAVGEDQEGNMPSFQFPSPEERVKYYMGKWYDRTITDDEETRICSALFAVDKDVKDGSSYDKDIFYSIGNLIWQVNNKQKLLEIYVDTYLGDALKVLNSTKPLMRNGSGIVLRIGDSSTANDFMPVVCKTRPSCLVSTNMTACSAIVWPIRLERHYGPIQDYQHLVDKKEVVSWKEKKLAVIWRGGFTGVPTLTTGGKATRFKNGPRVQAVTANFHYNKSDIDLGFSAVPPGFVDEYGKFIKIKLKSMVEQLQYKYILNVEGNDVSTGLKWQLASNSVVFMAKPATVSFAMEDLLVPFVHYIPVKDDFSNVMEMVEWARSNDEKCQWISEQATKFMNDLWISDNAKTDNTLVKMSLAKRYQDQLSIAPEKCLIQRRMIRRENEMLVQQFYCQVLQRPPESEQRILVWLDYLKSHTVKDMVRSGILGDEFKSSFVHEKSNETIARTLYDVLLARPAGEEKEVRLFGWENVVDRLLASPEYNLNFGDDAVPGGGREGCVY